MYSVSLTALLLSAVASFCVASSETPKINLPPCTNTLCITPCGFKLIEEFSLNVTGFPVDKDADYIKVSAGVNTEKEITSLKFRLSNIEAETVMGSHHVRDFTMDACEQQKQLGYPVCPILPHRYVTFSMAKQLGFVKSFAKGLSATITAIDQDQVTIACVEVKIAVD